LPDAHTEAPTAGSVILAGVLLKMGTYGFVRFGPALFPDALVAAAPLLAGLAIVGIVYGAAVSWAQTDFKRLISFSSVSHLGFVMLGIAALNEQGFQGSLLQMVNHGISTGALFIIVVVLYDRTHTRELADYGGVAARMPRFAALFVIVLLSSAALPGTNGFVGEFLILLGAFRVSVWWAALGVLGVVLSAVYLLWAYQQVMHGPPTARHPERLTEITPRELLAFAPLVALIFAIGLYPRPLLDRSEAAVRAALDRLERAAQTRIVPQAREPR
ncbi:MAG: NADH-quinone oxidoreductase subunit M, partial [Candidatus Rokubacteria bacterium]|nr:NADH-quinone oxidoreductase subunit M [Candidatus Rokubacteria bacterium]